MVTSAPETPAPTPRTIVKRAEAPESSPAPAQLPVKLSAEEIRAMATMGGDRSKAAVLWERGRIMIVPTGLMSAAAHAWFREAAPFVFFGMAVGALLWSAWPLFRRDSWS